jgi:hypothetical protein
LADFKKSAAVILWGKHPISGAGGKTVSSPIIKEIDNSVSGAEIKAQSSVMLDKVCYHKAVTKKSVAKQRNYL